MEGRDLRGAGAQWGLHKLGAAAPSAPQLTLLLEGRAEVGQLPPPIPIARVIATSLTQIVPLFNQP